MKRVESISSCLCVALAFGCAAGGDADEAPSGGGAAGSASGGTSGSAGSPAGGGTSATGGSGGSAATGGSGGATGGSGGGGGTGGVDCPKANECQSAENLGTLSGDSGDGSALTASGGGQQFFRVRATEDNHSVLGEALELRATLIVPPGADFDLYAYVDTQTDTSPCPLTPTQASANGPGTTEEVTVTWGDGLTGSNENDGRDVVLEVRFGGFSCQGEWSLSVQGDP
jgi:hypothetical protein